MPTLLLFSRCLLYQFLFRMAIRDLIRKEFLREWIGGLQKITSTAMSFDQAIALLTNYPCERDKKTLDLHVVY